MNESASEIALSLKIADELETLIHFKQHFTLVSKSTLQFQDMIVNGPCLIFCENEQIRINDKPINRLYMCLHEEILRVTSEEKSATALVILFREKNHGN